MEPTFDLTAVHRFFSADCFNRAWDEMDKTVRTAEEDAKMLLLGYASLFHWTQRPDSTPTTLSVGCWQVSRIHSLLKQAEAARFWAARSLEYSQSEGVEPFYQAYAYEALARAEKIASYPEKAAEYLVLAREWTAAVQDEEARKMLLDDLLGLA